MQYPHPFSGTPTSTPTPTAPPGVYLDFIQLNVTVGVTTETLPALDDGATQGIPVTPGFPFGNSLQASAYVNDAD